MSAKPLVPRASAPTGKREALAGRPRQVQHRVERDRRQKRAERGARSYGADDWERGR